MKDLKIKKKKCIYISNKSFQGFYNFISYLNIYIKNIKNQVYRRAQRISILESAKKELQKNYIKL